MTENISICPDCGGELLTVDAEATLPLQALRRACEDCSFNTIVAVVNYPDGFYEVVADALPGDECDECDREARYRVQKVGDPVRFECEEHVSDISLDGFDLFDQ